MNSADAAVIVEDVSFSWPDGTPVFTGLCATFTPGVTGLIGANGAGKTTLLRLIGAELTPHAGRIHAPGRRGRVPQLVAEDAGATVSDLLGISRVRAALRAIEAGSLADSDYESVGEDWDIETRALALLGRFGFAATAQLLDAPATRLSGGQASKIALLGARLAAWDLTLLDEPTNNLDAPTRGFVYDALTDWPGVVIVASHDRTLLNLAGHIADLDPRGIRSFRGNFDEYRHYAAGHQAAAERRLAEAEAELARAKRRLAAERERERQRNRAARRERAAGNVSKAVADYFANRAEKNAGSKAGLHAKAVRTAAEARAEADAAARMPQAIRIDLPETALAPGKQVLAFELAGDRFDLRGPERIRITGINGAGKSTLLGWLTGSVSESGCYPRSVLGDARLLVVPTVPVGFLRQRHDDLDQFATPLDAIVASARSRGPQEARRLLARFNLTGDAPVRSIGTLSGGERFKVALARVLFAVPAPQLLVLDEPANNLDMASLNQLADALTGYRGALLVVTHDERLTADLGLDQTWTVAAGRDGIRLNWS